MKAYRFGLAQLSLSSLAGSRFFTTSEDHLRALRLREQIEDANHAYYVLGTPVLTDGVYDSMYAELVALESAHEELRTPQSPTQRVGAAVLEHAEKYTHPLPMQSLENVSSRKDFDEWEQRWQRTFDAPSVYMAETKLDGVSLSLTYVDGKLQCGTTRGDGLQGENITANARTIRSIPLHVASTVGESYAVVRGEVVMPLHSLAAMNEERTAAGQKPLSNARNACAGALRQLRPSVTSKYNLVFYAYDAHVGASLHALRPVADTQGGALELLRQLGFKVEPNSKMCTSAAAVEAAFQELLRRRDTLDVLVDGMVVKIDDIAVREVLGVATKFPRHSVAWKFPADECMSIIEDIIMQVGRTGALTPVAVLQPVRLAGTVVARATLHNDGFIASKDLRVHDSVVVRKAGDVIPAVVKGIPALRPAAAVPYVPVSTCPSCHTPVVRSPGGVARCANSSCGGVLQGRITHFVGRDCMNIVGVGAKLVEKLIAAKMLSSPADLYLLTPSMVATLPGSADKSAAKVVEAIHQSKDRPWATVLHSLGIPLVGKETALKLGKLHPSLEELQAAHNLADIPGIGPEVAHSVHSWLGDQANQATLAVLRDAGVCLQAADEDARVIRGPLSGQHFFFTGALSSSRSMVAHDVTSAGGHVSASLTRKVDYVVVGSRPGEKNVQKAQELGKECIDEDTLRRMLGGR